MINNRVRILIADDEPEICDIVKRYLGKRLEADIFTVDSGEQALALARDIKPDLLFLDVSLVGNLNGWQVVEELRKFDPQVRIVVVSGYGNIPEPFAGLAAREVTEYLRKPVCIDDLYRVALKALGEKARYTQELFVPAPKPGDDKPLLERLAHDLSNVQMTIQMHCAHFLVSRQDGYYRQASSEAILKDAAESFETIQKKCAELEKIILALRAADAEPSS
ncbi:MAG: response regulator [Candidatus Omnitrophica bacterium]|nr:response regulator [Candidatus Omnitrophota bacterium]